MPFYPQGGHHGQTPSSAQPHQQQHPGAGSGVYQAAQNLGSIGAPQGTLRSSVPGTTAAGIDSLLPGGGSNPGGRSMTLGGSGGHTPGQHGQEMQLQQPASMPPPQQQHLFQSNEPYTPGGSGGGAPNINLQHATPQSQHQQLPRQHFGSAQNTPSNNTPSGIPGSLTPGSNVIGRPNPPSAFTAPTTVPTVPHIQTNAQQYTLPTRSSTLGSSGQPNTPSHSYSRSSPGHLEQKYIAFSTAASRSPNTSTDSRTSTRPPNATPPQHQQQPSSSSQHAHKFFSPTTPSGAASQSPLGLADIRPRADSSLDNTGPAGGSGPIFRDTADRQPGNSCYLAPWGVYAFDWCKWSAQGAGAGNAGKMAIGSYLEDPHNFIQILDTHAAPQEVTSPGHPPYGLEYTKVAEATCSYPVTRILWEPPSSQKQSTDLLATSGDHLRLWSLPSTSLPATPTSNTITRSSAVNTREQPAQKLTPLALLSNSKSPEHTAPLTSLDWNTLSPKLIITSSIDTTCTIWDIPTLTAKTQLIAHDREVFDVRFCAQSVDVFVSCGADGSVRMFDLRSLEHSTIIYEPAEKGDKERGSPGRISPTKSQQSVTAAPPLLRLAASPHDAHLLATLAQDSPLIRILDVRQPGQALLELRGHAAAANAVDWCPSRRGMLASGADDSSVLVWDLLHAANGASLNGTGTGAAATISSSADLHAGPDAPAAAVGIVGGPVGQGTVQTQGQGPAGQQQAGQAGAGAAGQAQAVVGAKGPAASWRCDYEVGNLSWAPQSGLTGQGGEWVGVVGGRGVWGVKL